MNENHLTTKYRTHTCGQLDPAEEGKEATLAGWINRRRDHGGLIFIDLRDRYGKTQVVFHPDVLGTEKMEEAKRLRMEDVVAVRGLVRLRPEDMRNPDMPTGDIEVRVEDFDLLSRAETTPFVISNPGDVQEDLRFTYRYLDLRRPELQKNLLVRHAVIQSVHRSLNRMGFAEIETPILTKRTPEGARDYLVPSRVHPGKFYALPQSPQLYKQLLMVAGLDRYYQIARCFRDEDLRADRQPEFTQIDIEMSFAAEEDVIGVSEEMVADVFRECLDIRLDLPLPRMTFREAMDRYGIDRPDLRFDLSIHDLSAFFRDSEFGVFRQALEREGRVRGIGVPGGRSFSRKDIDELTAVVTGQGGRGLLWVRRGEDGWEGMPVKHTGEGVWERVWQEMDLGGDDILLLMAGDDETTDPCLCELRLDSARRCGLVPADEFAFTWVVDHPLFGIETESGEITPLHHPFTSPRPEQAPLLEQEPLGILSRAYDLVLNGFEIGGGSIRISDRKLQERIFRVLNIGEEEAQARFGFFLDALTYGAPPHGGIAFGLDRLVMLVGGGTSIREFIAFPKTTSAYALCEDAPSEITDGSLEELHIKIRKTEGEGG